MYRILLAPTRRVTPIEQETLAAQGDDEKNVKLKEERAGKDKKEKKMYYASVLSRSIY